MHHSESIQKPSWFKRMALQLVVFLILVGLLARCGTIMREIDNAARKEFPKDSLVPLEGEFGLALRVTEATPMVDFVLGLSLQGVLIVTKPPGMEYRGYTVDNNGSYIFHWGYPNGGGYSWSPIHDFKLKESWRNRPVVIQFESVEVP